MPNKSKFLNIVWYNPAVGLISVKLSSHKDTAHYTLKLSILFVWTSELNVWLSEGYIGLKSAASKSSSLNLNFKFWSPLLTISGPSYKDSVFLNLILILSLLSVNYYKL